MKPTLRKAPSYEMDEAQGEHWRSKEKGEAKNMEGGKGGRTKHNKRVETLFCPFFFLSISCF
jgi:hypothetical protein